MNNILKAFLLTAAVVLSTTACVTEAADGPNTTLTSNRPPPAEAIGAEAAGTGIAVKGLYSPGGAVCEYDIDVVPVTGDRVMKTEQVRMEADGDLVIAVPYDGVRLPFGWNFLLSCGATEGDMQEIYDLSGRVSASGDSEEYTTSLFPAVEDDVLGWRSLFSQPLVVVSYEKAFVTGTLTTDLKVEQNEPLKIEVTTSAGVDNFESEPSTPWSFGPVFLFNLETFDPDEPESWSVVITDSAGRRSQIEGAADIRGEHLSGGRSPGQVDQLLGNVTTMNSAFEVLSVPIHYPNPLAAVPHVGLPVVIEKSEPSVTMTSNDGPSAGSTLQVELRHREEPVVGVVRLDDGNHVIEQPTDDRGVAVFYQLRRGSTYDLIVRADGFRSTSTSLTFTERNPPMVVDLEKPLLTQATSLARWSLPGLAVAAALAIGLAFQIHRRSPAGRLMDQIKRAGGRHQMG